MTILGILVVLFITTVAHEVGHALALSYYEVDFHWNWKSMEFNFGYLERHKYVNVLYSGIVSGLFPILFVIFLNELPIIFVPLLFMWYFLNCRYDLKHLVRRYE